jgi:hypothetical protein
MPVTRAVLIIAEHSCQVVGLSRETRRILLQERSKLVNTL